MRKHRRHKIAIFIIAYQAAETLISAYKRIPAFLKRQSKEIYCFDDCSNDNTYYAGLGYKIANKVRNFTLYKNPKNLGYGGNQKKGYRYGIKKNYDLVVMLHGDAQYAPEKMPLLLEPFHQKDWQEIGMVMGSRMMGDPLKGGMPLYKFVGNKILTWLENKILGTKLTEFHSGYRVINLNALKNIPFEKCSSDFHFDSEIIIMLLRAGYRIVEVPIPTYYGPGSKSSVNVFKYGINCLKAVAGYRLAMLGFLPDSKFSFPIAAKSRYGYKIMPESSHQKIAKDIKDLGSREVLDLGCAGGFLAEALGKRWKGNITGLEIDESWAESPALKRYKKVAWDDLNNKKFGKGLKRGFFDVVVIADVLEHLDNPKLVVNQAIKFLKPGGYLITSMPNSGFLPVLILRKVVPFLKMNKGPLDYSHQHFYNFKSASRIYDKDSLLLYSEKTTLPPLVEIATGPILNFFFKVIHQTLLVLSRIMPYYFGYQIVLVHQKNEKTKSGKRHKKT